MPGGGAITLLNAITPEQQTELDKIFKEKEEEIRKETSISDDAKLVYAKNLRERKKELEGESDRVIQSFIDYTKKEGVFPPYNDPFNWQGMVFGAFGTKSTVFISKDLVSSAAIVYASFGPKYNFSKGYATLTTEKGFSLSLPIGLGMCSNIRSNDVNFALPIAIEAHYKFSDARSFAISGGLRYTFSPQKYGNLNIADVYGAIDLFAGAYLEFGYVFYSSREVKIGNRSQTVDTLKGAFAIGAGYRF